MKNVVILEFPSNLGLKEPAPGVEPGVKKLPGWLRKHNFYDLIRPEKIHTLSPFPYSMHIDKDSGVRNADAIVQYAKQQAALLAKVVSEGAFPVVIGGDCSILIGNTLALKKLGTYSLFFLDGHTDFAWPGLSQSLGAAGMDLAVVTGHGHEKLTNIDDLKPYIREGHAWCVGNRDYEERWVKAIQNSNINYVDLNALRKKGIDYCVDEFLKMVYTQKLDGFWIHFDVDVLNDDIMPAVDSREKDGLTYDEFSSLLQLLLSDSKAAGIEITILDPDLDPTGEYTKEFVNVFCNSFNKVKKNSN